MKVAEYFFFFWRLWYYVGFRSTVVTGNKHKTNAEQNSPDVNFMLFIILTRLPVYIHHESTMSKVRKYIQCYISAYLPTDRYWFLRVVHCVAYDNNDRNIFFKKEILPPGLASVRFVRANVTSLKKSSPFRRPDLLSSRCSDLLLFFIYLFFFHFHFRIYLLFRIYIYIFACKFFSTVKKRPYIIGFIVPNNFCPRRFPLAVLKYCSPLPSRAK